MSGRRDPMDYEPWRTVAEHLNAIAEKFYELTGRGCITRLSIASEVGPSLGLMPGTSIDMHTAAGAVEIYIETAPRGYATIRFAEPGSAGCAELFDAPSQYVCSRCLRGTLGIDCLARTCTPAHQDSARPMSGETPT